MKHPPIDRDVRALSTTRGPDDDSSWTVESVRESDADVLSLQRMPPPDVRATRTLIDDVPAEVYLPPENTGTTLVFLHGGGFVVGSEGYTEPVARLAKTAGCAVVMPELSVAPESPFPTALNEARRVLAAICTDPEQHGLASGRVGLVGDSSGGNLAAIVASELKGSKYPLAFQVLLYPMLNAVSGDCLPDLPQIGGFSAAKSDWYFDQYLNSGEDRSCPEISPLRSKNVGSSPPSLFIVPGLDPLRQQALEYADLLCDSGVEVTVWIYPGTVHGFYQMDAVLRSARRLGGDLGRWIRLHD